METDSGRYGVGAEKLDPKRLGVATYPGAKVDESEKNSSHASLYLDWGKDSTRLYHKPIEPPTLLIRFSLFIASNSRVRGRAGVPWRTTRPRGSIPAQVRQRKG